MDENMTDGRKSNNIQFSDLKEIVQKRDQRSEDLT